MSESNLKANFGKVWPKFLEFEISRSKRCMEIAGSVNGFLILQVIAYHNLSLIKGPATMDYAGARNAWVLGWQETLVDLPYILNYAAISELTGLDKETTRRGVLKLEKNRWVSVDKTRGIIYAPSDENQRLLLELNDWELSFFGKLVESMTKTA